MLLIITIAITRPYALRCVWSLVVRTNDGSRQHWPAFCNLYIATLYTSISLGSCGDV